MTIDKIDPFDSAVWLRWHWKILGIKWKEMVRNYEVQRRSGQSRLEGIIRQRWLRWLGHLHRMDEHHISRQAMHWIHLEGKKRQTEDKMD